MNGQSFNRSMSWLHEWAGLLFGWLLFPIFLTGAICVFSAQIGYWATPALHDSRAPALSTMVATAEQYLDAKAPHAQSWRIALPSNRFHDLQVGWRGGDTGSGSVSLNPATGQPVGRSVGSGSLFIRLHYSFGIDRRTSPIGIWIVGAAGLAMLVGAFSGIIIHKRIFRDFFQFRASGSRQRRWMDAHNVLSVLPLPFHVLIAYTGLVVFYSTYMPAGVHALYGGDEKAFSRDMTDGRPPEPVVHTAYVKGPPLSQFAAAGERQLGRDTIAFVNVSDPGTAHKVVEVVRRAEDRILQAPDRIAYDGATGLEVRALKGRPPAEAFQSILTGMHYGYFGGALVQWLYFLCGLAGAASLGAGLILFVVKRREKRGRDRSSWDGLVDCLNVAFVAGPVLATAVYFVALRLASLNGGTTGAAPFFLAWLAALLVAPIARGRAWAILFGAAATAFALAAGLGLALPSGGLVGALRSGDATLAAIDLTLLLAGIVLGGGVFCAVRRQRILSTSTARPAIA